MTDSSNYIKIKELLVADQSEHVKYQNFSLYAGNKV